MRLINLSPFVAMPLTGWKVRPPRYSLTMIVKGTFVLVPDGPARVAEQQALPSGDIAYPDDPDERGVYYPSDFAHFKPGADLLVAGSCHARGGIAVPVCRVSFTVGGFMKQLAIVGSRSWTRSGPSEPQPFRSLALRYEHAFGGAAYPRNPIGTGFDDGRLPSIEDAKSLIRSRDERPEPAGFGPIPMTWPQRMKKSGTFDDRWRKERWPFYPEDVDWSFENAAPSDQQMRGYLGGEEPLAFENLHPRIPDFRSRLPGLGIRCFVQGGGEELREVAMNLDTLWACPEEERLILCWRGVTEVESAEASEIRHALVASEPVSRRGESAEHYRERLREALRREKKESTAPPPEPKKRAVVAAVPKEAAPEPVEVEDPEDRKLERDIADALAKAGLVLPSSGNGLALPPRVREEIERLAPPDEPDVAPSPLVSEAIPPAPRPLRREELRSRVAKKESLAGLDLTGAPLYGMDLTAMDLSGAVLRRADLRGARLEEADLTGADLSEADLTGAIAPRARFADADLTAAELGAIDLREAVLEGAVFSRADLRGARLGGALGARANWDHANLEGADLRKAKLMNASFDSSRLFRADMTESQAAGASFRRAWGRGIRADRADWTSVKATEANFGEGSFRYLQAPESIWERAKLYRADFSFGRLANAEFPGAFLEESQFTASDLREARMAGAILRKATLLRVNLFRGLLEAADLSGADVRESNLYEAEVKDAILEGTNLDGCNLKMTKLA